MTVPFFYADIKSKIVKEGEMRSCDIHASLKSNNDRMAMSHDHSLLAETSKRMCTIRLQKVLKLGHCLGSQKIYI